MANKLSKFHDWILDKRFRHYLTFFRAQGDGKRIVPPPVNDNDKKLEFRYDHDQTFGNKKQISLQVNSQASKGLRDLCKNARRTHKKWATAVIDLDTPEDKRKEAVQRALAKTFEDFKNTTKEKNYQPKKK